MESYKTVRFIKDESTFLVSLQVFLDEGQYGRVYFASDVENPNQVMAVKEINKAKLASGCRPGGYERRVERVVREMNNLREVRSPNIVGFKMAAETKSSFYIGMEFCNFQHLMHLQHARPNRKFSEDEAKFLMRQIMTGMEALAAIGACHRDLKPQNLMLCMEPSLYTALMAKPKAEIRAFLREEPIQKMGLTLKITDLGFSKVFDGEENESSRTFVGTPGYMAPEIEALQGNQTYDAKKVDVYSIGAIWYYLLTGQVPTRYVNK
jgi:serine/threonine protein kinase